MSRLDVTVEYRSSRGGWCLVLAGPDGCQCGECQRGEVTVYRGFKTALEAIAFRDHLWAGWCEPCAAPRASDDCTCAGTGGAT